MKSDYKFYIQQVDMHGHPLDRISLEDYFDGCNYLSCSGLETVGAAKNIYTEDYPEADGVRAYHPDDTDKEITHSPTTIELSVIFVGERRRDNYKTLINILSARRFYYWDTARHKKALCVLKEEQVVDEDIVKGMKYIKATLKLSNLWGVCRRCNDDGSLL